MAKRQIETPVHNNQFVQSRSLDANHPDNKHLYETSQEFQELLKEVKIRFDTNPHFYQREDYQKLIELLRLAGQSQGGNVEVEILGDGIALTDIASHENILTVTKDYEFASEDDVLQIVPLLPEMVTDIVDGTFDLECLEDFTGNINYIPMTSQEVHEMIENIFNDGTTDSQS